MSLTELNEKYKKYPTEIREYEISGKKYRVHSHFVGTLNRYVHSSMERKAEYMKSLSAIFTVA